MHKELYSTKQIIEKIVRRLGIKDFNIVQPKSTEVYDMVFLCAATTTTSGILRLK